MVCVYAWFGIWRLVFSVCGLSLVFGYTADLFVSAAL